MYRHGNRSEVSPSTPRAGRPWSAEPVERHHPVRERRAGRIHPRKVGASASVRLSAVRLSPRAHHLPRRHLLRGRAGRSDDQLDAITARTEYPNSHKLILVICDGQVKGQGEQYTTPQICLSMMKDNAIPADEVVAYSYVAVASGSKRHNMARIHAGFYDYGEGSAVPLDEQKCIPMMIVEKCGTEDEANMGKPGNRGKRDSQIILMSPSPAKASCSTSA